MNNLLVIVLTKASCFQANFNLQYMSLYNNMIVLFFFKVLPLENEMKKPEDFTWVLNVGMGIISVMFVAMSTLGYLAFGNETQGSVSLNLPDNM